MKFLPESEIEEGCIYKTGFSKESYAYFLPMIDPILNRQIRLHVSDFTGFAKSTKQYYINCLHVTENIKNQKFNHKTNSLKYQKKKSEDIFYLL